jgi:hypothetical protein
VKRLAIKALAIIGNAPVDAVERAVRAALEKGNAQDRAFRLKIYASAQAALERTLASRGADSQQLDARRKHLASIIKTVELGFLASADASPVDMPAAAPGPRPEPALAPADWPASGATPATPPPVAAEARREPFQQPVIAPRAPPSAASDPAAATIPAFRRDPALETPATPASRPPAGRLHEEPALPQPERRVEPRQAPLRTTKPMRVGAKPVPWLRWGFNAAFLAAIALGGWWLYGEAMRQYELALSDGGKPQLAEEGDAGPAEAEARLVEIFAPANAQLITAPPGTEAKLAQSDGSDALSIRTLTAGTPISIAVGQGVLRTYAGQRVLFNIKARAEGAQIVDMSVGCSFAGLGECERKRFRIAPEVAEYMFAVTLEAGAPQGDGVITFEPDVSGGGAAVQILAIRVSPVEGG